MVPLVIPFNSEVLRIFCEQASVIVWPVGCAIFPPNKRIFFVCIDDSAQKNVWRYCCKGSLLNEAHQDKVMAGEQRGLYLYQLIKQVTRQAPENLDLDQEPFLGHYCKHHMSRGKLGLAQCFLSKAQGIFKNLQFFSSEQGTGTFIPSADRVNEHL